MKRTHEQIIESILADGESHSAYELSRAIANECYGGAPSTMIRIGARIHDLKTRKEKPLNIEGFHDNENAHKYWYQVRETPNIDRQQQVTRAQG